MYIYNYVYVYDLFWPMKQMKNQQLTTTEKLRNLLIEGTQAPLCLPCLPWLVVWRCHRDLPDLSRIGLDFTEFFGPALSTGCF